ncbi:hypothetical protein ACHQM5_010443 [Ranunculus cassubicifolius]
MSLCSRRKYKQVLKARRRILGEFPPLCVGFESGWTEFAHLMFDEMLQEMQCSYNHNFLLEYIHMILYLLCSISNQNPDGYTHAVYMRFQRKEDLAKFYGNSSYLSVLREHVMPLCHEFNYGIKFVLLISVVEGAVVSCIVDALDAFVNLTLEYPSFNAQATQGSNFNPSSSEYTHVAVIRFRSSEAFKMFVGSPSYIELLWMSKFETITKKFLAVQVSIEPAGTEIM